MTPPQGRAERAPRRRRPRYFAALIALSSSVTACSTGRSVNRSSAAASELIGVVWLTWNWWPTPSIGTPRAISRATSAW